MAFLCIARQDDGTFALSTNGKNEGGLSISGLSEQLDLNAALLLPLIGTLREIGASQICQRGAELKLGFRDSDTRGYLHIDESCAEARTYRFWSGQAGNFTADHPGSYVGLYELGNGWYYYAEQR